MSDRVRIVGVICGFILMAVIGYSLKWAVPLSDYQRLNAVEARLDVLEDMLQ